MIDPTVTFTDQETVTLRALRADYRTRARRDLFTEAELAHLRFLQWLVSTGRIEK